MLFPVDDDNAVYLSRTDEQEALSSYSAYGFFLDDMQWPTVAHYFHAMKFDDVAYRQRIREAATPQLAKKLGRNRLKRIRKDWKKIRVTVMTRAVYTRCRTHQALTTQLLETAEKKLIENSAYDYFWGCGRDRRGENQYGQVLMNVRKKLQQEQNQAVKQGAGE